jgi:hypothetical protein
MLTNQINQVEQRIKNLQRSMNAELESLLNQLQHLKELEANAKPDPSIRIQATKEQSLKIQHVSYDHIPEVLMAKDVQSILGIGINKAYDLVVSGDFHYLKVGRKIFIPKQGFIEWLEGRNK